MPNKNNGLLLIILYVTSCLIGLIKCTDSTSPRLEIFPINGDGQQKKPIGYPLMLTCRPEAQNTNLVTDLQWRDNSNNTILAKQTEYKRRYDSNGQRIQIDDSGGPKSAVMYTEQVPGENILALIIPKLTDEMTGYYYCSASYANTQLLEAKVRVETYVAITWTDAPLNQFPIRGIDFAVKCQVKADPHPTVTWRINGEPIKTNDRYVVETYGLIIRNVQDSDDGIYTCRASVMETGELDERHIRVEVYVKPEIQTLPPTLDAVDTEPFSVYCNATGKPVPEISWIKDQTQQNVGQNTDRFKVDKFTGLLQISRVEAEDHGTYTCTAINAAGVSEERTKLNVLISPKIEEFYNATESTGNETAITCRARGRPAPEITFKRWGSEEEFVGGVQPDDGRITLEQFSYEERGDATGTLRIRNTMRSDDGLYQCVARNQGNTAYRTGHITVMYPPNFDHMKDLPPVFSWEERVANLSCLAMGIPNATIEWRLNGRLITELYDRNLQIVGRGPQSDLIIKPVDRKYYTVYKCLAINPYGKAELDMILREARLPEPIPNASQNRVTATTITFEIIQPNTEPGLPFLSFSVQYKESHNPDWSTAQNRSWAPNSPYIVENLKPQTLYDFRFAARNQVGLGQWSALKQLSTSKRSVPEKPKALHTSVVGEEEEPVVISPYSDQFELRWNVPADNGEPIDFYRVKYCPGAKVNGEFDPIDKDCRTDDVARTTTYSMANLAANMYYQIELTAHNAMGFSEANLLYMKTVRGIDVIPAPEKQVLTSAAIVGIAIGGVLLLLIIIDVICCAFMNMGVLASMCRKTKRSPSEIDDEAKLGSLYGWRFPLPYCSGQMVKEPPPSPLPLPPPVKLGGSPMPSPLDEKEPLNTPPGSIKKNSSVEFDGRFVHSRSGDIIGKNSAV